MEIAGRPIGDGAPTYVIAELSANHQHSFEAAVRLVEAAADAGADAIKLQTYTADTITIDSERPEFRIASGTVWDGRTLHDLYTEAATPWEWHEPLQRAATDHGMHFFSSPFDDSAVEFLDRLGVPAFKIASFEIVDMALIGRVARTGRPMIISTGMATLDEVTEAVATARENGARELALLKCTSAYPAPPEEANLCTIPAMATRFSAPVGLSDHTLGIAVPVAAVALGAVIVEKHLTLSRGDGGPDAGFSLEPSELREMVAAIRVTEKALGSVSYEPTERESPSRILRRSLFVVEPVRAGETFTEHNVRSIRPGQGLHTRHLHEVLGARAARDVERGTPMHWGLIANRTD
ncbi:MAG: pseudaminic acid synthase [Candidatus Limnocylindria bacterium]